jgi:hypothetical protein
MQAILVVLVVLATQGQTALLVMVVQLGSLVVPETKAVQVTQVITAQLVQAALEVTQAILVV